MSSMPPETTSALPAEPVPAEVLGLRAAELAARVRQALYRTPPSDLAEAYRRMREGATARHLDYFMDGAVQTIRVFPCPITLLPEEVDYVHRVVRTLHDAMVRLPDLYLADPDVRSILRLEPEEDAWLRDCWRPAMQAPESRVRPAGRAGGLQQPGLEGHVQVRRAEPDRHRRAAPDSLGRGDPERDRRPADRGTGRRASGWSDSPTRASCCTASSSPSSRRSGARGDACVSWSPSTSSRESTSSDGWSSTCGSGTAWKRCTPTRASSG